ncbi:hypothetical protein BKA82DRAFT_4345777 [Pisolithus tinctorius]|nr:hypothetical protein BKA82DRAFT_4345777 [Pisolithus tinctorius]
MAPPGAGTSLPASSVGYTPWHLQYAVQREHWQRVAHCPPPAETISLEVLALYESGVRKKGLWGNPIRNICKGLKDINALASAAELMDITLHTITPCSQAFHPEFLWHDSEFVVCDAMWVDLFQHSLTSNKLYFYAQCLHLATHKNSQAMVFKAKQFSLYIVIPASQWQELEAFQEKLDDTAVAGTSMLPVMSVTNAATTPKGSEAPAVSAPQTSTTTLIDCPISHDIRHLFDQTEPSTSLMIEAGTSMLAKCCHHQSSSISSTTGLSPPHKKSVTSVPDLDNLKSSSDILSTAGLTIPWHKKPLAMSLSDPELNSISSATGFTLPQNKPATVSLPDPDPILHFVVAGLVVAYSHHPGGPTGPHAPKLGSASAMYLAEELIRFDDGSDRISGGNSKKFMKFIHNSNPNPFPEPGEYGYEMAEFLAFTQHVQYSNTNGQVYISDYQGSMMLLSDPQILTHLDVNQGRILFGEGNLEDEVAAFEHQHICNKYCKWTGFQLEVFGKGKAQSSGTASCKGKTRNAGEVF